MKRVDVFEQLNDGVTDKREIEEQLGVSRQTVSRAIDELETVGLIEYDHAEGYATTRLGDLNYDRYVRFAGETAKLSRAKRFLLDAQPPIELDFRIVSGGSISVSRLPDPEELVQEIEATLVGGSHVKIVSPIISRRFVDVFSRKADTDDEMDIVFDDGMYPYVSDKYGAELREWLLSENCRIYAVDIDVNAVAAIIDDATVWLGVCDDSGGITTAVTNDEPEAVAWTQRLFETYRSNATRMDTRQASTNL
jgi:predicted transcriptional regulator